MSASTKAATKRAERERRRANGEVRCELWLDDGAQQDLSAIMKAGGMTREDAICTAMMCYRLTVCA